MSTPDRRHKPWLGGAAEWPFSEGLGRPELRGHAVFVRQRRRSPECLRQPLLAGALLRRRGRHHPRQPLGEGRHEQPGPFIQHLLGVEREFVSVKGLGVEAGAEWNHMHMESPA